jgi:C-terminal processing protease CtpA/Prc
MNGVNLNLFQFERDLTFMAFFMDAQDRFYARYGGRDDGSAESHLSKVSLLKVMQEVLRLHHMGTVQTSRYEPSAGPGRTPEEIASLARRIKAHKGGQARCLHCHDIKQGELIDLREAGKFSRSMIFSYPMPSSVGIGVDQDDQATVQSIKPGSPWARAGLRPGDVLKKVDGQRILTAADFARVLELTPKEAALPVEFQRRGKPERTVLRLAGDWRKTGDPSWRSSIYVAGPNAGFWAEELKESEKRKLGLAAEGLALRVVAFFGDGPAPRKAGLQLQDVVVAVDGKRQQMSIKQLHAYCQMERSYGDKISLTVLRNGKERKLTLELPDKPARLE